MHIQYTTKLRKALTPDPQKAIIPTQYELFYSLLKVCVEGITAEDVTPELLNRLSGLYGCCRDRVEELLGTGGQLREVKMEENRDREGKCYDWRHQELVGLIEPFLKYLPKTTIAKLIYNQFMDVNFYRIIQSQREKAEQLIINDSGNLTPLVLPGVRSVSSVGNISSGISGIQQLKNKSKSQGYGLSNIIKNKISGNKLHIFGTNQLSIIFWLNTFKFDYAIHFDIFYSAFQSYLNTNLAPQHSQSNSLSSAASFYSNFVPNLPNNSVKQKIRQLVDPQNKYYVTSANCNQLFMHLSEPELLSTLAELTTVKIYNPMDYKSTKVLTMSYRWKPEANNKSQCVSINNFGSNPQKLAESTQPLPQKSNILITGCTIAHQNKIMHNRFPPTVRFGSLNDNEICIKNKYISRRQFMIIEEMEVGEQAEADWDRYGSGNGHGNGERGKDAFKEIGGSGQFSGFVKRNKYGKVLFKSERSQKYQSMLQSKYYLVCISPSNHTALVYQHRMQVKPGMIFKHNGIHIQVVRLVSMLLGGQKQKPQQKKQVGFQPHSQQQNTTTNLYNISTSVQNETIRPNQRMGDSATTEVNFQLLTSIPVMKTQQNQQEQVEQEYDEETLLQLPVNKSMLVMNKKLQCKFLSGEQKNTKVMIQPSEPIISVINQGTSLFKFEVQNGIFYVPKNIQILAKNANQVLSGHLSDKVLLQTGMKIVLEEMQFEILE